MIRQIVVPPELGGGAETMTIVAIAAADRRFLGHRVGGEILRERMPPLAVLAATIFAAIGPL